MRKAKHPPVFWLFLARAGSGIATANLGTASAYIADVTKPEERSKGMGLIGMAFGLGFILGPAIGGALSGITIAGRNGAVPCFVAASLSEFSLTSRLVFLVVGPMVDLKLVAIQSGTFGAAFARRFAPTTLVVAVTAAVLVGSML